MLSTWLLHILLISGLRLCWRMYQKFVYEQSYANKQVSNRKRTLIVGAGSAGTMVARQLQKIMKQISFRLDLLMMI